MAVNSAMIVVYTSTFKFKFQMHAKVVYTTAVNLCVHMHLPALAHCYIFIVITNLCKKYTVQFVNK